MDRFEAWFDGQDALPPAAALRRPVLGERWPPAWMGILLHNLVKMRLTRMKLIHILRLGVPGFWHVNVKGAYG
jgi:hypothetical protein